MAFDMIGALRPGLPDAPGEWKAPPRFSFVGGHNDSASVPFAGLAESAVSALRREGGGLAHYNLGGSPLGLLRLREFVASSLAARAGLNCDPDQILIVSGSLQALDLVNNAMLSPGDTIVIEEATYGGMLTRLNKLGVNYVGVGLDEHGIKPDHLDVVLGDLAAKGTPAKYVYTIPTVQNPTGTVMPRERRLEILDIVRNHDVPIFEDDCYADLTWGCERPPSIQALDGDGGQVIYCGSFSKTIAPSLRVGYIVGAAPVIRQILALKSDAGTGAIEQLTLAEYAPTHFDEHVDQLMAALQVKCAAMMSALRDEFGDTIEVTEPQGGIYVWVTFPEGVDTTALVAPAAAAGIEFNAGEGWSVDPAYGRRRMRLCFGHVDVETIAEGVAALAEIVAQHS